MTAQAVPYVAGAVCLVALFLYSVLADPFNLGVFLGIALAVLLAGIGAKALIRRRAEGPRAPR